jgi:SPP1 gp7 family putative phage head morphogenesis protein
MAVNETPATTIKTVFDTGIPRTMRSAETLSRTLTNGIANQAKIDFYTVNNDIINSVVYTATLDGRTSIICASLDGREWDDISKAIVPPVHPNCRSVLVPSVDGFGIIGERPSVGEMNFRQEAKSKYFDKFKAKGLSNKEIAARWNGLDNSTINGYMNKERREFAKKFNKDVIGSVPAKITYPEWLKKQSNRLQDDVLGKTRADLFRKGELEISSFVSRTNNVKTLDDLFKEVK